MISGSYSKATGQRLHSLSVTGPVRAGTDVAGREAPANGRIRRTFDPRLERPLVRRRNLPRGRAAVGAFLIAAAAVGIFNAYLSATSRPRQSYVVAARALPVGARLTAADLRLVALDLPDAAVRGQVFGSVVPLIGASTLAPISSGAIVEASAVIGRGGAPGTREVSISVDRARAVAGTLKPGEFVDLLGTFGSGSDAYTVVMVPRVRVISLTNVNGPLGDDRTQLITFAPSTVVDAEAIAEAAVAAQVTLVRSAEGDNSASRPVPYRPPIGSRPGGGG
jgi:Flp pilus assembly protein CpaB